MLGLFFLSVLAISGSANTAQADVLCPGTPEDQYCDCADDCDDFLIDKMGLNHLSFQLSRPGWCGCEEALDCCQEADALDMSEQVLCPGQSQENYCDCDVDCTEQPAWCDCQQAEECCNSGVKAGTLDDLTFDDFITPPLTPWPTPQLTPQPTQSPTRSPTSQPSACHAEGVKCSTNLLWNEFDECKNCCSGKNKIDDGWTWDDWHCL